MQSDRCVCNEHAIGYADDRAIIHGFEQLMRVADFTPDYLNLSDRSGGRYLNWNSA